MKKTQNGMEAAGLAASRFFWVGGSGGGDAKESGERMRGQAVVLVPEGWGAERRKKKARNEMEAAGLAASRFFWVGGSGGGDAEESGERMRRQAIVPVPEG